MNAEQIQAFRDLIEFARDYAEDAYIVDAVDDADKQREMHRNFVEIIQAADAAEAYLND